MKIVDDVDFFRITMKPILPAKSNLS